MAYQPTREEMLDDYDDWIDLEGDPSINDLQLCLAVARGRLRDAQDGEPYLPPVHYLQERVDELSDALCQAKEWESLGCYGHPRRMEWM